RQALPLPPRPADPADRDAVLAYFSITLSHPRWLAARWYERLGFDAAEAWLQFDNHPARLTLRANRIVLTPEQPANRLPHDGVQARRVDLLRKAVAQTRAANVRIVRADLLAPPFQARFDEVVVDVPCSGLGTLRRDPDIRWRRGERDLAAFAATELKMLQRAAEVVAPGGRLLYATCSSEPEENEGVVDAFLASTSQFVPVHAQAAAPHLPVHVIDSRGHLRTEPHRHGLEAFF